jgi:hypothetical protein
MILDDFDNCSSVPFRHLFEIGISKIFPGFSHPQQRPNWPQLSVLFPFCPSSMTRPATKSGPWWPLWQDGMMVANWYLLDSGGNKPIIM